MIAWLLRLCLPAEPCCECNVSLSVCAPALTPCSSQALGVWLMGALALSSADLPEGAFAALAPHALAFSLLNQWWLGPPAGGSGR